MKKFLPFPHEKKGAVPQGPRPSFIPEESGSVLFYIFLAMGLLAALTFSFTKNSRENASTQTAHRMSEEIFSQINVIRAAVTECTIEYPEGGGDLNGDGFINTTDNPNTPYPVNPSDANNPHGAAASDEVRNLSCTGAPAAEANIFQGANNKGRVLPPIPSGFSEWLYINDADGVSIQTVGPATAGAEDALARVMRKFATCQADLNYDRGTGGCGSRCLTVWIKRAACP